MKKMNRVLSILLAAALLAGCLTTAALAQGSAVAAAGGWFESLFAVLPGVSDADVTAVGWTGTMSGELTGEDFTYLVRDVDGGVRVDVLGLKAGAYTLRVTAAGTDYVFSGIPVRAYDRSGFAHKQHDENGAIGPYTDGVGAYNDDGTLKDNALVLYVTEENKETVSVTAGGVTVTGIGNILNSSGKEYEPGTGTTKKGGKANTNQDILKLVGAQGRPLVVRFVGAVSQPQGVSQKAGLDYGGSKGDNGGMAGIREINNITLEGVGDDAVIDGWGFTYVALSSAPETGLGRNFEARNLTFRNVPEDCLGINGSADSEGWGAPVEHCWVHNCAFYRPTIENPAEEDKGQGDGALDFKVGQYMTSCYNYFEGYHKTSLLGGGDKQKQYHVTWHHNWWKNCESRGPLARQANMHIYNNLYDGQSFYCMSLRANCYIFSEYNTFLACKNPFIDEGTGGVAKSYNDIFVGCYGKSDSIKVADRTQTVESANQYANFDTDAKLSYIPAGDYQLDTDPEVAVARIKTYSGTNKAKATVTTAGADPAQVDPTATVSRQQMAVLMVRYAQRLGLDTTVADAAALSAFTDGAATAGWAQNSVAWCVEKGILRGRGDGVLDPTATVTGAEAAVMFQRLTALDK